MHRHELVVVTVHAYTAKLLVTKISYHVTAVQITFLERHYAE